MTVPLRVLCVTPFGPTGQGGIDRLYAYLRASSATMPGIDLRFARSRGAAGGNLWVATFPAVLATLAWRLRRFRPDVVHINFATGGSLPRKLAVLRLAEAAGARTVVHFHGEFIERAVAAGTLPGRMFKALATRADRVIALGEAHAAGFARIGVPKARITILPNGIPDFGADVALPKPRGASLRILFAGLLTENKGAHILIPALARLKERGVSFDAILAGNGAVADHARMAREASIGDRVAFPGWIDADTLHHHMRDADVVVLPSRTEALPLSLIEGACAGAALVATEVGNVRSILHEGVNGVLSDRTLEALAASLEALAGDREKLASMQVASRQVYSARFTLAAFAEGLEAIYREVGARPRGH